jgi:hypothetical protein
VTRRLVAAVVLGAALAGCGAAPPPRPPVATYELPPRPVRPDEQPLRPVVPTTEGDTVFELIGLTSGIATVLGSHAEWPARGAFIRIRLVVTNSGRNTVPFDATKQLLVTADGATLAPDPQAMLIKRQPGRFDLGPTDRLEFDLYYDIPPDAKPSGLHAFGGPTLTDFSDAVGVDIAITPLS